MRAWMLLAVSLAFTAGCTNTQLRVSTVRQVSTLTQLQERIVLDNLAAIACNPDAIPFQVNLMTGTTQVVDSGHAGYITRPTAGIFDASRSIVDQWGMSPVTDEITLRLLRVAYRRAVGFGEDLYTYDLANRVAHRLKAQIIAPPDVAVENAIMFSRGPALPQLLDRAGWQGETALGFESGDPAVQRWRKDTSDIIATNSDRIIQVGEVLTTQNLNVAPVLVNGRPIVSDNNVTRVMVATPYAAELRRQVMALNDYLLDINPGWFGQGCKRDVPKCACYVGHHKECECDCYVWVLPEARGAFEDFTLRTLYLISLILEPNMSGQTQGLIFSPATSSGR